MSDSHHSVLGKYLTSNFSNINKVHGFDTRIYTKPMGRQDAPLTKPTMITANPMAKNNLEAGLSPTSSSCPQLTVEEPTESYHSEEETDHSHVRVNEARKPFKSASSKQQVKTYSFRRMLSFRGSLRGSGSRRSNSTAAEDSASSSPGLQPHHRPLQFSFLGQIYKTRSTKKQQQRRSSSQKVRQQTPGQGPRRHRFSRTN